MNEILTTAVFEQRMSTLNSVNPSMAYRESVGKVVPYPADPSFNLSNKTISHPKPSLPLSLHPSGDEKDNIQSLHELLMLHMLLPAHHG